MTISCVVCGKRVEAKRSTRKYCSRTCSVRASQGVKTIQSKHLEHVQDSSLVESVRSRLTELGQADTPLGLQAIQMAALLSKAISGHASISKELSRLLDEAAAAAPAVKDPVDELRERRERRLASA